MSSRKRAKLKRRERRAPELPDRVRLRIDGGLIRMDFGTAIRGCRMDVHQACQLADSLAQLARAITGGDEG